MLPTTQIRGATRGGGLVVTTPALFAEDFLFAGFLKAFWPHFPKPESSTSFEMIKIAPQQYFPSIRTLAVELSVRSPVRQLK